MSEEVEYRPAAYLWPPGLSQIRQRRILTLGYDHVTKKPVRLHVRYCRALVTVCGTNGAFVNTGKQEAPEGTSMTMQVVWHGTQQESFDLVNAIARNCTCEFGLMGVRLATCAPHRMLTEDQRALNGLLFARRMAERLSREEFSRAKSTAAGRARDLTSIAAD
jgi:hypothetical protein